MDLGQLFPSPIGLVAKPWEAEIHGLGVGLTVLGRHPLTPA